MPLVLKHQVEASEKSVQEIDELMHQHARSMTCFDVEDLLSTVVGLLRQLEQHVGRWQARGAANDEIAAEWFELFERVGRLFDRCVPFVKTLESWGFQVAGKQAFSTAHRDVENVVAFSPQRVIKAIAGKAGGRGVELRELLNALHGNCRA